ncbi:UDP-N-acetylglucosamine--LPS N-acetylglucosamine transferase [Marinactinospora thermotolerans]|uniref:UDP-N-acetylglucosamine:LPS N-acetylglucosamine transferase n=1 Tax=Marinactinospora thermotolerans DSM 45154 TaxID=1122192 RepID=A0A1T4SZL6_9ACTN|nr:UDP-N-acetylglucosamine--LPS N-acetylglucosamine transferase [Marinactinospora thermotolerans]SKA33378.1 UDP-N-acetylglucosamine:LPS N-acetylglucosamine transferase [Marinactinospora thermotolerans DSM 45154]
MSSAPVLFVASSGGHLAQLCALRPWWEERERAWVTFRTPDAESALAGEDVRWAYHPTTRHLGNLVRNTVLAARTLARTRPSVVVSTGAGVALPFFALAWLLRIPTVYIEVYDRIDTPTLTARLCRPFTRLFLAQWEEQRAFMPTAITVGPLL